MTKQELDALKGGVIIYGSGLRFDRVFINRNETNEPDIFVYQTGSVGNEGSISWIDEPTILANYEVNPIEHAPFTPKTYYVNQEETK